MSPILLATLALAARPRWAPSMAVTEGYNTAIMAIRDSHPEKALELLGPIVASDPDCGLCLQAQAIALIRSARTSEALVVLDRLAADHDRHEVHTLRAVSHAAAGDHQSARNAATRAVNQEPQSLAAQRALLDSMLKLEEQGEAQRVLKLAHKRLPQPEAACLAVEYALAVDNQPGAHGAMSQCRSAADPRLIQELELKLARTEGDLGAMINAAKALGLDTLVDKIQAAAWMRQGALTEAQALLDDVLSADPDDLDALLLRAQCHQARGEANDGLRDLDRLKDPSHNPRLMRDGSLRQFRSTDRILDTAGALRIVLLLDANRAEEARLILDREGISQITVAASLRLLLGEHGATEATAALGESIQRWPDAPQLPEVALLLTEGAPPSAAIIGWMQSLPDRKHAQTMAAQQHHHGRHASCLALLAPLNDPKSQVLAHRCATSAGNLDEANRRTAMAAENATPLNNDATMLHAWLMGRSGAPQEGQGLIDQITPTESEVLMHRSLRVWLAVEAGALESAIAAADEGALADAHRAHLASALHEAGHHRQARVQMQRACTELSADDLSACREALEQMKESP